MIRRGATVRQAPPVYSRDPIQDPVRVRNLGGAMQLSADSLETVWHNLQDIGSSHSHPELVKEVNSPYVV
jgi:hypothetical protein